MQRVWPNPCVWPVSRIDADAGNTVAALMSDPPGWVDDVIHFWFQELGEARWFAKSSEIDAQIRDRFLQLHEQLVARRGPGVSAPRAILAAIIVLDQFSRNLFRDDARAFVADPIARQLSRAAIEQGIDTKMKNREERYFLYLPFEHSEDRADQALAHALIQKLGNDKWTQFADNHMMVIERFGRFPYRNKALKRPSTVDELAFLKEGVALY
jgi:uncharacterized protein (DUF924 family)